jgi:two-component system response regulator MprA
MPGKVLIIDADPNAADSVRRRLAQEGYAVEVAHGGESGMAQIRREPPDLLILEVLLPDVDGLEVCRRLQAADGAVVPVLMLTVKDTVADRVACLDAGADEYVVKPYAEDELLARVRALLRRRKVSFEDQVLRYADLVMDTSTREVLRGKRLLSLTAREFDLLRLFLRHPRQVLTRDIIYDHIWGYDYAGESNIIEVYIRYLRTKLEAGDEPRLLQTFRGVGYALREE